ncbi:MAG: lytic transglycosylase domain-containing protein [Desulfobacterota bacterium]|nr:lytic transglycosylase domain-containing protein [Thermodesulfobacteriota bacterium]
MIPLVILSILIGGLLLNPGSSSAGIYKWVDENGVVHFTNCPPDARFKLYIKEARDDGGAEEVAYRAGASDPLQNRFDGLIEEFARRYNIDFALLKAMIRVESGFNPQAVSRKGAMGLMQLMPETAQRMNVANVFNPRENIDGGVRYFKYLLSLFNNDLRLSLAAYNAGEKIVSELRAIPPYRETIDYVRKVLTYYQLYKH